MRKNRKISKRMSRISVHTMHIGAIMVTFFAMIVLNLMASSSCSQLTKTIAEKEMELAHERTELNKSIVRWEEKKASRNLEQALCRRGMAMDIPSPNQRIRMGSNGRVLPGQNSVALLRRKKQDRSIVSYEGNHSRDGARRVIR